MEDLNEQLNNAVINNDMDKVKYLVEHGVDVTYDKNFAVQLASSHGYLGMVKYLVSIGADITDDDNLAVQWTIRYDYPEVVNYLIEQGAKLSK